MKIVFKDLNIEEDFKYSPEVTINQVREWAAPKQGCEPTNLSVLQRGNPNRLSNEKSFEELSIGPKHILKVFKTKRNHALNAAKYHHSEKSKTGKSKYNISQFKTQAKKISR